MAVIEGEVAMNEQDNFIDINQVSVQESQHNVGQEHAQYEAAQQYRGNFQGVAGIERLQPQELSVIAKLNKPLNDTNWTVWKEWMKRVLRLCGAEKYAAGTIVKPKDPMPMDSKIWEYNDNYAQVIIVSNISSMEMVHISQCDNAHAMWTSLEAVHEAKGHQTIIAVIRNLFHTIAEENANINKHLNKLLHYWECVILIDDDDFHISDPLFKVIMSSSLPVSWDIFTESYMGGRKGMKEHDPKKLLRLQEFIGILKEKYL